MFRIFSKTAAPPKKSTTKAPTTKAKLRGKASASLSDPKKPDAPKPVKAPRKPWTFTIGPVTVLITLIAFLAVGGWAVFATSTIVFGDKLSARLIAQQSDMQFAYEQKLIVFRSQLDRIAQQARSDRSDVEGRITDLMLRQASLEARQGMLLSLAGEGGSAPGNAPTPPRRSSLPNEPAFAVLDKSVPPHDRLNLVERSIDKIEKVYASLADNFVLQSRVQLNALRTTLADLGIDTDKFAPPPRPTGFALPKSLTDGDSPFEAGLAQARRSYGDLGRLKQAANALPLLRPVTPDMRQTSPFGVRVHPIYGTERMHAGLDFAVPEGTPVKAAGAGVVQSASVAGGYGNLVIIDHGNGITTRYAHLSAFLVQSGQPVAAGMMIAKSGNTGASTGPHLHYETRVKDAPKDPNAFLSAGQKLIPSTGLPPS